MKNKIIFCNIAWMKDYKGVTDDDRPFNGGKYIKAEGSGGEIYNFLDENGKCYGYVRPGGNIAIENHYKDVKAKDEYVDGVLVVWVATNQKKETRIVGWYKNARVYRKFQDEPSFTNQNFDLYYNIVADAVDCCLLPVEERNFEINRASEVGKGMGIGQSNTWFAESKFARANKVPAVIKYIEEYEGDCNNLVFIDEVTERNIDELEFPKDFEILYSEGLKLYEKAEYYDAMICFKAAYKIDENVELIQKLGYTLLNLARYDEALKVFNKLISLEGETINSLEMLMVCYDRIRDTEKTIEYIDKIISFESDSYEDIELKRFAYIVKFDIYIYQKKFKKAEEIINLLHEFLEVTANYSKEDVDNSLKTMKEVLERSIDRLIKQ